MLVDVEKYRHHVQSIDLPQDRKDELIHIVFAVMQSFVDRAFGVHPVQLCLPAAEQKPPEKSAGRAIVDVNSNTDKTDVTAADSAGKGRIP
jgi:hypothetical protein